MKNTAKTLAALALAATPILAVDRPAGVSEYVGGPSRPEITQTR